MIHRCRYCGRLIWPWQHMGFRYLTARYVRYWHADPGQCR